MFLPHKKDGAGDKSRFKSLLSAAVSNSQVRKAEALMLTISKPLSASQAQTYHAEEFTSADQAYYSQANHVHGEWQGKLAEAWDLKGEVRAEQFEKLANGFHPVTGEEVVRQREGYLYKECFTHCPSGRR
jgi:hypothetical protein